MPRKRSLLDLIRMDLRAAIDNDPAARGPLAAIEVVLTYPGFHAITLHRLTHEVHHLGIPLLPKLMALANRFLTGVEIHPAARIGGGLFIDHGMGVVIGETTIIGENCVLFHQVTLGGTGKECGKRHPTLMDNVVVGGGAKVLGNITLGRDVYIGANSVVLSDVPEHCTVVGIPGRVVRVAGKRVPLDHIHMPDPIRDRFTELEGRVKQLTEELDRVKAERDTSKSTPGI